MLLVLAGIVFTAGTALAGYPDKAVTIIVPSKAGGGTDTMARLVAKFAEKYLGQPLVVVDKPGAGGQIGFEAIARAKKDGYTIGCLYTPHVTAHISSGRSKYTLDSFVPIANVVTDPGVLVVKTDSPFETLSDLVEFAKKNPGKLNAATSGPGGDDDFALKKLEKAADIQIKGVPAKGSSGEKAAVLGGHVDMAFMNASQVDAQVRSGELRVLGIMTTERRDYMDAPTFTELGYKILSDSSRGFAAPAGLDPEIMDKLSEVFKSVLTDPEFIKASEGQLLLNMMDSAEYGKYLSDLNETTDEMYKVAPW